MLEGNCRSHTDCCRAAADLLPFQQHMRSREEVGRETEAKTKDRDQSREWRGSAAHLWSRAGWFRSPKTIPVCRDLLRDLVLEMLEA